jgi:hypothetical protein
MSGFWSSIFGEEENDNTSSEVAPLSPVSGSDASQNSWDLISNSNSGSDSSLSPVPEEDSFIGESLQADSKHAATRSLGYGAVDLSGCDFDKRLEVGDAINGIYFDTDLGSINAVDGRRVSPQSLLVASDLNSDSGSDFGEAEDIGFKCCAGISNCMDSISKSFDNCVTSFFDKWMSCCCDEDITDDNKTYKKVVSVEV